MGNVNKRNMITEMTELLKNWADEYFANDKLNIELRKMEVFEDFVKMTSLKKWSSIIFWRRLKVWCKYHDYEFNPEEQGSKNGKIVRKFNGKATDFIYIHAPENRVITDPEDTTGF